ncbi:MAG: hypothetical protein JSR58_02060 [Verrucomicrobia bacterium]|nr:hypothetical protein [Verrucomicrobiota bacterium]
MRVAPISSGHLANYGFSESIWSARTVTVLLSGIAIGCAIMFIWQKFVEESQDTKEKEPAETKVPEAETMEQLDEAKSENNRLKKSVEDLASKLKEQEKSLKEYQLRQASFTQSAELVVSEKLKTDRQKFEEEKKSLGNVLSENKTLKSKVELCEQSEKNLNAALKKEREQRQKDLQDYQQAIEDVKKEMITSTEHEKLKKEKEQLEKEFKKTEKELQDAVTKLTQEKTSLNRDYVSRIKELEEMLKAKKEKKDAKGAILKEGKKVVLKEEHDAMIAMLEIKKNELQTLDQSLIQTEKEFKAYQTLVEKTLQDRNLGDLLAGIQQESSKNKPSNATSTPSASLSSINPAANPQQQKSTTNDASGSNSTNRRSSEGAASSKTSSSAQQNEGNTKKESMENVD